MSSISLRNNSWDDKNKNQNFTQSEKSMSNSVAENEGYKYSSKDHEIQETFKPVSKVSIFDHKENQFYAKYNLSKGKHSLF